MKTFIKIAAVAVLAITAMSCKTAPKYELTDGEWVMTAWHNDGGEEMMITQNRPTMKFEEGRVFGMAGCNNFNGRYKAEGDKMEVDLGAMTMKMCLDMTLENRMVTTMPLVTNFKIDGNQLLLFNKEGKELFRFDNAVEKTEINQ